MKNTFLRNLRIYQTTGFYITEHGDLTVSITITTPIN